MTNLLILGANGQLARNTTRALLRDTDASLTLYLRRSKRLQNPDPRRVRIVEGDVLDSEALTEAMTGQDLVYARPRGRAVSWARRVTEQHLGSGREADTDAGNGDSREPGRQQVASSNEKEGDEHAQANVG
jgi:hypothetical protein